MAESCLLPNLAEDFASQALLARLPPGHNTAWRGQNIDTQTTQDTRYRGPPNVNAAAGTGNARQVGNGSLAIVVVLQVDTNDLVALFFCGLKVRDIALVLENAGNLQLQLRSRYIHLLVPRADRITNSRQHVCDR